MIRIAVLDHTLPAQIRENPDELEDVDVVWSGSSLQELDELARGLSADVLVVNLELLGDDPLGAVQRLSANSKAEMVLTLYSFARKDLLSSLGDERRRAVRAPVSLARLRAQMTSLLVRRALAQPAEPEVAAAEAEIPARRFTSQQLGRLLEISTAVDCECPNHLADLVSSLSAFEDYARKCENENEEDAALHNDLFRRTARARSIMELALEAVIEFERIVI